MNNKQRQLGRWTDSQWEMIRKAAQKRGTNRADWAKSILLPAARRAVDQTRREYVVHIDDGIEPDVSPMVLTEEGKALVEWAMKRLPGKKVSFKPVVTGEVELRV